MWLNLFKNKKRAERKYRLSNIRHESGLRRIIATKNFADVQVGDVGGWIEGEHNLSHIGMCWVYDDAIVRDFARVEDDAQIYDNAVIRDKALIRDSVGVFDFVRVSGTSVVKHHVILMGDVIVDGKSVVDGIQRLSGFDIVSDNIRRI